MPASVNLVQFTQGDSTGTLPVVRTGSLAASTLGHTPGLLQFQLQASFLATGGRIAATISADLNLKGE
jgi:hypothetical protein